MKPLSRTPILLLPRHARLGLVLAAGIAGGNLSVHANELAAPSQRVGLTGVQGSGKLQTEQRAVGSFEAVALHASMNLLLRQGAREAMELRADDNLLALVETRVITRSGVPTLEIRARDNTGYSSRNPITVTVDVVTLSSLSVRGSGDVSGDGLKAPALKVAVAGSGNVRLKGLSLGEASLRISGSGNADLAGKVARLSLSISGSGDVEARALEADEVSVSIAGSGDAHVNARRTLNVSIAGSGDVDYTGDPTVKTAIAGSGHVKKR